VTNLFRTHLNSLGFIEIHSPKLQGAATESGASVFEVNYFKGKAFLAQSPQLAKQMCIAGDMERVYEIAPGESDFDWGIGLEGEEAEIQDFVESGR
jgi:aspartyl/asparaginyl-tRNA synthetase